MVRVVFAVNFSRSVQQMCSIFAPKFFEAELWLGSRLYFIKPGELNLDLDSEISNLSIHHIAAGDRAWATRARRSCCSKGVDGPAGRNSGTRGPLCNIGCVGVAELLCPPDHGCRLSASRTRGYGRRLFPSRVPRRPPTLATGPGRPLPATPPASAIAGDRLSHRLARRDFLF